jgi:hypothetical protein
VPLFLLPRRPLLAKAERVWWGVSGSISLRTEGGRARREGRDPDRQPRLFLPLFIFLTLYGDVPGAGAAGLGREPRGPGRSCLRAGAAAAASPPGCGRTGLFLAAPPRTEVTRRSARRGRARERRGGGGRKRERLSQRRHRIPQRVPGREAEPEKPVWSRRAKRDVRRTG